MKYLNLLLFINLVVASYSVHAQCPGANFGNAIVIGGTSNGVYGLNFLDDYDLSTGSCYGDDFGEYGNNDVFLTFTLPMAGIITLDAHANNGQSPVVLYLIREDGSMIDYIISGSQYTDPNAFSFSRMLQPGKYYVIGEGFDPLPENALLNISVNAVFDPPAGTFWLNPVNTPILGACHGQTLYADTRDIGIYRRDDLSDAYGVGKGDYPNNIFYKFELARDAEVNITNAISNSNQHQNIYLLDESGMFLQSANHQSIKRELYAGSYYLVSEMDWQQYHYDAPVNERMLTTSITLTASPPLVLDVEPDCTLQLPAPGVTLLYGSVSNATCPVAYSWTKQSGPEVTMLYANNHTVELSGLKVGQYVFRLTITSDNVTLYDEVKLTVTSLLPDAFAVAGGGPYPPGGCGLRVTLNGSQPGVNYQLRLNGANTGTPIAGTGGILTWPLQTTTGHYTILATNISGYSQVMNGEAYIYTQADMPAIPPTVSAGPDQSLTLPANSLTLAGVAAHPLCPVTYSWTKQSGPGVNMNGNTTLNLALTNLEEGSYLFRLTVTANGATAYDEVLLTVERIGPKAFTYTPNNNGNISAIKWNTKYGTVASQEKIYAFAYDKLNRLIDAYYADKDMNTGIWQGKGNFNEESMAYDLNGNMLKLRRFDAATGARRLMDNLNLQYIGNQLKAVNDSAVSVADLLNGFEDLGTKGDLNNPEYVYDGNGNMIEDKNKKIKISYNYLNLPDSIAFGNNNYILYFYNGAGVKRSKEVYQNGTLIKETIYDGDLVFENNKLDFIATSEGRVKRTDTGFNYEYFLKDHLGNVRVVFDEYNGQARVIQQNDYYPFGLQLGVSYDNSNGNRYKYNGKELQNDNFGGVSLGMYDYGARFYDPLIGRWNGIDALSESYESYSPYNYVTNNPVLLKDPNGNYITIYYEDENKKEQKYRYEYGQAYEGNNSFVTNIVAQLDYLIENSPSDQNIIKDLAEDTDFQWGISKVSMEQINKKEERMMGDGITTLCGVGYSLAKTSFNDYAGTYTNTGGLQSPSTTLYHEGGHAYIARTLYGYGQKYLETKDPKYLRAMDQLSKKMDSKRGENGYLNYEERLVNETIETPFAQRMGEGIRTSDSGSRFYETATPFSTLPKNQSITPLSPPSGNIPTSVRKVLLKTIQN